MDDRERDKRIRKVLCEEWEKVQPGLLHGKTIHERLVAEGVDMPGGVLDENLSELRDSNLISLGPSGKASFHGRESRLIVTHVSPDLIDLMLE